MIKMTKKKQNKKEAGTIKMDFEKDLKPLINDMDIRTTKNGLITIRDGNSNVVVLGVQQKENIRFYLSHHSPELKILINDVETMNKAIDLMRMLSESVIMNNNKPSLYRYGDFETKNKKEMALHLMKEF